MFHVHQPSTHTSAAAGERDHNARACCFDSLCCQHVGAIPMTLLSSYSRTVSPSLFDEFRRYNRWNFPVRTDRTTDSGNTNTPPTCLIRVHLGGPLFPPKPSSLSAASSLHCALCVSWFDEAPPRCIRAHYSTLPPRFVPDEFARIRN